MPSTQGMRHRYMMTFGFNCNAISQFPGGLVARIWPLWPGFNTQSGKVCLAASQMVQVVKNPPAQAGDIRDVGLIPELGRSPGGGHGNPV